MPFRDFPFRPRNSGNYKKQTDRIGTAFFVLQKRFPRRGILIFGGSSRAVFVVGDLLYPLDHFAVERFLDSAPLIPKALPDSELLTTNQRKGWDSNPRIDRIGYSMPAYL